MAITWPSYSTGVSVAPSGTTIRWGTGNAISSTIVVSIDEREKVDPVYIEQGDGVEATRFLIKHGKVWDVTCIDSGTAFASPPDVGDVVIVKDILYGTGNGAAMTVNAISAVCVDNNYKAARKTEGQRTLRLEYLTIADAGTLPEVYS